MKLQNKKTGYVDNWCIDKDVIRTCDGSIVYNSLAELNKDWKDYEEPEGYWYYDTTCCRVEKVKHNEDKEIDDSIGNCFKTKEEAEKAVEKLKVWKRLKDKGFRFVGWCESVCDVNPDMALFKLNEDAWETDTSNDLDLLFGGKE